MRLTIRKIKEILRLKFKVGLCLRGTHRTRLCVDSAGIEVTWCDQVSALVKIEQAIAWTHFLGKSNSGSHPGGKDRTGAIKVGWKMAESQAINDTSTCVLFWGLFAHFMSGVGL